MPTHYPGIARREPLIVYAGSVGGERALNELEKYGMGRLIAATAWKTPEPGIRWCFDNGAFHAFMKAQRTGTKPVFPEREFLQCLHDDEVGYGKIEMGQWGATLKSPVSKTRGRKRREGFGSAPDFGVCPDIVCGGMESLRFSLAWIERLMMTPSFPWYLAVQDGMTTSSVAEAWEEAIEVESPFGGIFVGGSLPWKYETSATWVRFAHERGVKCHIGRVSSVDRLKWAEVIGADSVDSSAFGQAYSYGRVEQARRQESLGQWSAGPLLAGA